MNRLWVKNSSEQKVIPNSLTRLSFHHPNFMIFCHFTKFRLIPRNFFPEQIVNFVLRPHWAFLYTSLMLFYYQSILRKLKIANLFTLLSKLFVHFFSVKVFLAPQDFLEVKLVLKSLARNQSLLDLFYHHQSSLKIYFSTFFR
jgi:hypothetical protein